MSGKRYKMNNRKSRKVFTKTAMRKPKKNYQVANPMRGGYRL